MATNKTNFTTDLKRGQRVEDEFMAILVNKPELLAKLVIMQKSMGRFAGWDISLNTTFEVKYDEYSVKSGNMCFELKSLEKTESDYFVYKYFNKGDYNPKWIIFKTSELLEDIETHKNKLVAIKHVGDGYDNLAYLFSITFIENNFRTVK